MLNIARCASRVRCTSASYDATNSSFDVSEGSFPNLSEVLPPCTNDFPSNDIRSSIQHFATGLCLLEGVEIVVLYSHMLRSIELVGFKSFGRKSELQFDSQIAAIVGPNGSGKSNVAEGFRFVLGEQSMKSLRSKKGEDLIWGGSPALPRANRAAVKVTFDNAKRVLDLDFPEIAIERVVYRDGQNEYLINGTKVRLKDVVQLLAGANIAGTGYQIISQG